MRLIVVSIELRLQDLFVQGLVDVDESEQLVDVGTLDQLSQLLIFLGEDFELDV